MSSQINLRHGVQGPETRTGTETETCTACAGTIILEFAALSRFTGDTTFEVEENVKITCVNTESMKKIGGRNNIYINTLKIPIVYV